MNQDELAAYIASRVEALNLQSHAPQFVAISGPDCAGKSTIAADVLKKLKSLGFTASLLSIDAFLIPRHLRVPKSPEFIEYFESAFNYSKLVDALQTVRRRANSESTSPSSKGEVCDHQRGVLLVEGVFLLRKELRRWWNLAVWLEVETSVIINRAIKRDKEYFGDEKAVRRVYETRCLPAQRYHMHRDRPKQSADITAKFENGLWVVRTSFRSFMGKEKPDVSSCLL